MRNFLHSALSRIRSWRHCPKVNAIATKALGGGHLVYFGAVSIEGHGLYAIVAGALLVFSVLSEVTGDA
jgi:hypothetical protein